MNLLIDLIFLQSVQCTIDNKNGEYMYGALNVAHESSKHLTIINLQKIKNLES